MSKTCPPDKILNPVTSRCVKRDGKIGKALLKSPKTPQAKPKTPQASKPKTPQASKPSLRQELTDKLKKACEGKSRSQGGLNVSELKKLAKSPTAKTRKELLDILCKVKATPPTPKAVPKAKSEKCNEVLDVFQEISKDKYKYNLIYSPKTIEVKESGKLVNKYTFSKDLGKGAYGEVKQFKDKNGNMLAAKITKDIKDYLVYKDMKNSGCKTINMRRTKYGNNQILIMNSFDGDLADYFVKVVIKKKEPLKVWAKICEDIRKMLVCLLNHDIYYTDLKPQNILVCTQDGEPKYYIGDLGGAYISPSGGYTYSYVTPEKILNRGVGLKPYNPNGLDPVKFISYHLGVLYIYVLKLGTMAAKMKSIDDAKKIHSSLQGIPDKKVRDTLLKLLEPDPKKRTDLRKVSFV